jgi:hypothetical protein
MPSALAAAARWTGLMCEVSPNKAVSTAASKSEVGDMLSARSLTSAARDDAVEVLSGQRVRECLNCSSALQTPPPANTKNKKTKQNNMAS